MPTNDATSSISFPRSLWPAALLLVALLIVLHAGAWSNFPPDADPINFTLALSRYSIADEAPHAPGYPLYVALAKGASLLVGKNHAYQLVNLGMLLIAGAALVRAMRTLGMAGVGLAAALLAFSHPIVWSTSVIAECYVADAMFACVILAWTLALARRPRTLLPGILFVFFMLGMIRPVSGAMLAGLAAGVVLVRARPRSLPLALATGLVAVVGTAIAWAITAQIAGGFKAYAAASDKVMGWAFRANSVLAGAPASAHVAMLKKLAFWLALVAGPPALLAIIAWARGRASRSDASWTRDLLIIVALWLVTPLSFYAIVYYLKPSYLLIVLPGLALVAALSLFRGIFPRSPGIAWCAVLALTFGHLGAYFLAPKGLPEPLYRITNRAVRDRDEAWRRSLDLLREAPRDRTLLVWDSPMGLSPLGARLLDWPDQVAVPAGGLVSFFAPYALRDRRPDDPSDTVPARYARVAVLGTEGSVPKLLIRELTPADSRRFDAIMRAGPAPASGR
jgi:hypothetical protein